MEMLPMGVKQVVVKFQMVPVLSAKVFLPVDVPMSLVTQTHLTPIK
jgi:hypothetical protein